ncbi:unnamed protein product, partial [Polarella glacialis]
PAQNVSCDDDDDDDDMPPLECVGTAPPAASKPARKVSCDDDDDEMPPLDYVGTAPPAASKPAQKVSVDEEDDMPPLEYVGNAPSASISFREGDQVILKGLSKAELNGQRATVDSFQHATKGRLPVKLELSGQRLAIKPDNLEKVGPAMPISSASKLVQNGSCDENDDDMPPLEYVGTAPPAASKPVQNASCDDDDDDMPPLEYVGTAPPAASKPARKVSVDDDDDDEMPPLDYVGTAPPAASKPAQKVSVDEEDDMPPLEYVGNAPSASISFREGDQVILKGLSKAELNGQRATVDSFQHATKGRLPVKLELSGQRLAIKPDNLEKVGPAMPISSASKLVQNGSCDEDDDDMPPLEYVGTAPPAASKPVQNASCDDDDDDMPPLEYVGTAPPAASKPVQNASCDDDDDDMPPLEYVGTAPPAASKPARKVSVDEDDDDEMPPLNYVGTAPPAASKPAQRVSVDEEDDMPPLEYVGNAPSASISFREGDQVILKGLSKAELNGQRATVDSFQHATKGRLPVKLELSGQRLAIKPENLEKVGPAMPISSASKL